MHIIPIASGKGGVGKSLIAANLGVAFAQIGQRVVIADLDLGASNLHVVLGHRAPKKGIGTFLNDPKGNFNEVIADTDVKGLRFIPGDTEIPGLANLKAGQLKTLVKQLIALQDDADILILDLGAGTHQSILDFFLLSERGIVVSAPMVTAVLNAYVFLKNTVFRLMFTSFSKNSTARAYLEKLRRDNAGPQKLYIPNLLPEIKRIDKISFDAFSSQFEKLRPRLIMNMVDNPKDAGVGMKIRRSCKEYLDLRIEHLGIMYRDSLQDTALASRLPIVLYKPQSILSQSIYRIADIIMQGGDTALPDERQIDESFQEAEIEAEIDFENRNDYVGELLHSGVLNRNDLVETVKWQQIEISKLKKESNFIKLKLSQALSQGYKV
jgi:flagellar biosynthesis protein FlhG